MTCGGLLQPKLFWVHCRCKFNFQTGVLAPAASKPSTLDDSRSAKAFLNSQYAWSQARGFPFDDKRTSLTCCCDNGVMALQGPSVPLYLCCLRIPPLMRNFLRALPEKLFGEMHLSVQQITHCSRGHILPSLPLSLNLPVSWCPHWWPAVLAPAHHITYSPTILCDYQTNNVKLNFSLGVAFPSLAGKQTTQHYRGMMKLSPLSFVLLWKLI